MLVFESVSKDLTKLCLSIAQVFSNIASVIQQFTPMNQTNKIVWLVDTIHKAGKISYCELNDKWVRNENLGRRVLPWLLWCDVGYVWSWSKSCKIENNSFPSKLCSRPPSSRKPAGDWTQRWVQHLWVVCPSTYDLYQEVLRMGTQVEVLEPNYMREEILEMIRLMYNQYTK